MSFLDPSGLVFVCFLFCFSLLAALCPWLFCGRPIASFLPPSASCRPPVGAGGHLTTLQLCTEKHNQLLLHVLVKSKPREQKRFLRMNKREIGCFV